MTRGPVRMLILIVCCVPAISTAGAAPATRPAAPAKILFDTDMDSDCDDVGALAMLHALADLGEAEILATVVSAKNPWSAPCVDAINTWYGRPDLPIGRPKQPNAVNSSSKYARQIAEEYQHDLKSGADAPDAVRVYVDVLSKQPERSVVILTVGDLTNIAALLSLPADGDRPSGIDLVKSKVKVWVCMGGNFIGRPAKDDMKLGNNNFSLDAASSLYAITHWPVELTFVGREIGSVPSGLKAGAKLAALPKDHPVRRGYELYFGGAPKDRHIADQTAVLYAVRGLRDYWDIEANGTMDLQPDMTFTWQPGGGKQSYLLKRKPDGKPNDRAIEQAVEQLMMHPRRGPVPQ
ncbi:nucleoside hydrolase [Humisphaera borealis]|uniref:Nucleoside hydrolase n=1 Tax=Humisphaera borealis TaxID=2807512 RepID=A0A7M2WVB0_9BACT|nr:nucleoside hydrolase [Humisphaera borealis]QOV89396.1 nucleoside hydrolase [Humisphaera borealis]